MLADHISPEKLPWIVVWLDWNFYAFWPSLVMCLGLAISHYWSSVPHHSFAGVSLAVFVGICGWSVYYATRCGYAVG